MQRRQQIRITSLLSLAMAFHLCSCGVLPSSFKCHVPVPWAVWGASSDPTRAAHPGLLALGSTQSVTRSPADREWLQTVSGYGLPSPMLRMPGLALISSAHARVRSRVFQHVRVHHDTHTTPHGTRTPFRMVFRPTIVHAGKHAVEHAIMQACCRKPVRKPVLRLYFVALLEIAFRTIVS